VTDINGKTTTGTINVSIVDDVPTAVSETARSVAEDAVDIGGNVLTNDTQGADGATVTSVTINTAGGPVVQAIAAVGTTTVTTSYGVYTFTAAGVWTFNPSANLNNAAGVDAGFTYIITDGDGDKSTASQPITVTDGANPTTAKNAVIALDEEGLGTVNATGTNPAATSESASDTVSFNGGSDNIASIVFGSTAGISLTGYAGTAITWSAGGGNTVTGTIGGIVAITLTLSSVTTGATAGATVTATLSDNFIHLSGSGENSIGISGVTVVATDTDGDTAAATVALTVKDDVPVAVSPVPIVVTNAAGPPVTQSLDSDPTLANNYGADGGTVRFVASLDGLNSGLTSNFVPIIYTRVNDTTLVAKAAGVTIFTITLNPLTAQYTVDMDGQIDSKSSIAFNPTNNNFVGGNNSWGGFIPLTETVGSPIDNNSKDLLLTPKEGGVNDGTINTTANTGGVSGGASVGSGETFRVDFVTDLRGNPADGAGDYGNAPNRDHVFDGHYTVNGASALLKSSSGSTVRITAFDDADGNTVVGDGVKDTINGVTISYLGGPGAALIIPTTTPTNYTINGRVFTVTLNADGSVDIAGVAGASGSSLQGTTIAVFTANGYNSVEYAWQSGDTFQIGGFGATTITNLPVSFNGPGQIC